MLPDKSLFLGKPCLTCQGFLLSYIAVRSVILSEIPFSSKSGPVFIFRNKNSGMIPIPERFTFYSCIYDRNRFYQQRFNFFHPDFTVGTESHQFMPYGSRALPPVGISPRPEALFGFTKLTIARYRNNCKIIFSTNQYIYAILEAYFMEISESAYYSRNLDPDFKRLFHLIWL